MGVKVKPASQSVGQSPGADQHGRARHGCDAAAVQFREGARAGASIIKCAPSNTGGSSCWSFSAELSSRPDTSPTSSLALRPCRETLRKRRWHVPRALARMVQQLVSNKHLPESFKLHSQKSSVVSALHRERVSSSTSCFFHFGKQ